MGVRGYSPHVGAAPRPGPGQPALLGRTPTLITKNPLWLVVKTLNSIVSPHVARAQSILTFYGCFDPRPTVPQTLWPKPPYSRRWCCVPFTVEGFRMGGNAKEIEDFPDRGPRFFTAHV